MNNTNLLHKPTSEFAPFLTTPEIGPTHIEISTEGKEDFRPLMAKFLEKVDLQIDAKEFLDERGFLKLQDYFLALAQLFNIPLDKQLLNLSSNIMGSCLKPESLRPVYFNNYHSKVLFNNSRAVTEKKGKGVSSELIPREIACMLFSAANVKEDWSERLMPLSEILNQTSRILRKPFNRLEESEFRLLMLSIYEVYKFHDKD